MIPECVEALDLKASQFKSYAGGEPLYFTAPPVVRGADLKGLDLLICLSIPKYLCSGRLKRAIEQAELTNFVFSPVVVK
jgi:hypothetical protein